MLLATLWIVAAAAGTRVVPDGAGLAESTGLLYAYGTGYYGLKHRGQLQPGETLLVLGAGGNVGIAAVELGVLMGARVIAAAWVHCTNRTSRSIRRRAKMHCQAKSAVVGLSSP